MKTHRKRLTRSKEENVRHLVAAKLGVSVGEVLLDVRADFRELMLQGGLAVMEALLREDVEALCGPRYGRRTSADGENKAERWGRQGGVVVMGGRKLRVRRPRVRQGGQEVVLPTYQHLQQEDPLQSRMFEQMVLGVSTRKYARSLEPVEENVELSTSSKSAVSRRFVARSQAQLERALSENLADREWVALMIDGIAFDDHVVLIVLGVDSTGAKHVLSLREGTTENATVCREVLSEVITRGVPADRSILVVIDGGKGLRKAISDVFGRNALMQRCQVHKRRNILDHLPESKRAHVKSVLEQAYSYSTSAATAQKQLENLARTLASSHPSAASSILEGLEETLTVKTLGLGESLTRTLATTNLIENLNGRIRDISRRVRRWRNGSMILRWVGTSVLEAKRGFRRLKGCKDMPKLMAALRQRDQQLRDETVRLAG